jgi:hypothetical protein
MYPCVQYLERNSYLCTFDLYGPVRNVFDAFHDGGMRGGGGSSAVMQLYRTALPHPPTLPELIINQQET